MQIELSSFIIQKQKTNKQQKTKFTLQLLQKASLTDMTTVTVYVGLSYVVIFPEQKCGKVSSFGSLGLYGKFHTQKQLKTLQVSLEIFRA